LRRRCGGSRGRPVARGHACLARAPRARAGRPRRPRGPRGAPRAVRAGLPLRRRGAPPGAAGACPLVASLRAVLREAERALLRVTVTTRGARATKRPTTYDEESRHGPGAAEGAREHPAGGG